MKRYDVKVVVEYNYEVEAEDEAEALDQGWQYEDYAHFADVYSIDAIEQESDEEEDSE